MTGFFRVSNAALVAGILVTTALTSNTAVAGDVSAAPDGGITWQAGVDGPEIEWNVDGTLRRISSRFATPVEFPDRRGIYKAQVIAEEKAKAAIIRYLRQDLTSSRLVKEIEDDLEKAARERSAGTDQKIAKANTRTLISNLTETTTSSSSGALRGVVVLEKGYDEKAEEAWAVVGISNNSMRAAEALKGTMDRSATGTGSRLSTDPNPSARAGDDGLRRPSSEVRRLNNPNW